MEPNNIKTFSLLILSIAILIASIAFAIKIFKENGIQLGLPQLDLSGPSPDPTFCRTDNDCTWQATGCGSYSCPTAINKKYKRELNCGEGLHDEIIPPITPCPPGVPTCIDNKCVISTIRVER